MLNAQHPDLPSLAAKKISFQYDRDSVEVTFPQPFPLYGRNVSSAWVNPNGMMTFDLPYASHRNAVATHFEAPRVVGLFADLAPEEQGQVTYELIEGPDARFVVTFEQVPEFGRANSASSFQPLGASLEANTANTSCFQLKELL